jgi:hypothetical protein
MGSTGRFSDNYETFAVNPDQALRKDLMGNGIAFHDLKAAEFKTI